MSRILLQILKICPMPIVRYFMRQYQGKLKQVIVVRTDLKMRRGKEISQGAHASMGGYLRAKRDPFMRMWLDGAFAKISVGVSSEEDLLELQRLAENSGLTNCLIRDAGRTEFRGQKTLTALSIGPGNPDVLHQITGHLKLR